MERLLFAAVFLAFYGPQLVYSFDESAWHGDWVGVVEMQGESVPLKLHVEERAGTISLPSLEIVDEPLTTVQFADDQSNLSLKNKSVTCMLKGKIAGHEAEGTALIASLTGTFRMMRVVSVDPSKYFGVYELAEGERVYIRTWDELGPDQLTYFTSSGRAGALHAVSNTEFVSGPGLWIALPVRLRVQFSSVLDSLKWSEDGKPTQTAQKKKLFIEETIKFSNSEVTLGGSLVLPGGTGPFPAMVLVHGSSPVTRDFFGPIAYLFASHGIAVLSYDKRGVGESEGDWLDADFQELASDASAAFQYLKSRSEIDADRIGLWGASQAGWIIPVVAANNRDVRFAVLLSVPAVKPFEQEIQRTRGEMRAKGLTEAQITEAVEKLAADLDSLRQEETRQALLEQVEQLRQEKKDALLSLSGIQNPRFLLWYSALMDYDPLPYVKKMECPVLVLYGELDRAVPVEENKNKLEDAFKQAGKSNFTFRVFPKGNHALLLSNTGAHSEFFHLNRFVPNLFDTMIHWIQRQTPK